MTASEIAEPGLRFAAANARRLRPLNAVFVVACALLPFALNAAERDSSPIYGARILAGYRQGGMIAPSHEAGGFNKLRGILGNAIAVQPYRDGTLPFPDGAMMAKVAWTPELSALFPRDFVPGRATTVQIMLKDAMKCAATGDRASSASLEERWWTRRASAAIRRTSWIMTTSSRGSRHEFG
jgi:hypothetical protein